MKYLKIIIFVLGLSFMGCKNEPKAVLENVPKIESLKDKEEIQKLIRNTINWAYSNENKLDMLPILTDEKDSICIGIDFKKHEIDIKILKESGFFADEFVENHNKVNITIDKKIKNKEYDDWNIHDMPPFGNPDVNPWCKCQDYPYESPNPFDLIEVTIIKLDKEKGELVWNWGNNGDPNWKNSEWSKNPNYKFRVAKENGKWKISYLELFDYKQSTQ